MRKPEDVDALINAMCLTWRHDFALNAPPANADGLIGWADGLAMGMTEQQRDGLRMQMRQLYEHQIKPAIMAAKAEAREAAAKVADDHAEAWGLAMGQQAKEIAAAIRSRKEVSP